MTGSKLAIRTKRLSETLIKLRAKYRDLITERILGWKTIKTFDTVDKEKNKISNVQNDIYEHTVNITKISALTQLFFVTIATAIIIFVLNILINNFNFSATSILIFGIAFMRLTPTFKLFQHNIARIGRIIALIHFLRKHLQ